MITDEGVLRILVIMKNLLLDGEARNRVIVMRRVFRKYGLHLGDIDRGMQVTRPGEAQKARSCRQSSAPLLGPVRLFVEFFPGGTDPEGTGRLTAKGQNGLQPAELPIRDGR